MRWGAVVTNLCTYWRLRCTPRSASSGTRSLVWKRLLVAMTWRRFQRTTSRRFLMVEPPS